MTKNEYTGTDILSAMLAVPIAQVIVNHVRDGCPHLYDGKCDVFDEEMRREICEKYDHKNVCAHFTELIPLEDLDVATLASQLNARQVHRTDIITFGELNK